MGPGEWSARSFCLVCFVFCLFVLVLILVLVFFWVFCFVLVFCGAGVEPRVLGKHSADEFYQVQPFRISLENVYVLFWVFIIFTAYFSH